MKTVTSYKLRVTRHFLTVFRSYVLLVFLLYSATTCSKKSDSFAKNVPECIKQHIKGQTWVICVEEYCSQDDTQAIYIFHDRSKICLIGYDENCKLFLVKSEEYNCNPFNPSCWLWGEMLPDGTIEFKEDIYHFKRIIFTKK